MMQPVNQVRFENYAYQDQDAEDYVDGIDGNTASSNQFLSNNIS